MIYKFMRHFSIYGALPLMASVALTGCVDNNYDLSDIDTTTEIKVKDLVIPINLDEVTLGDIIEIKEGSELCEVDINGEKFYAVDKSGDFKSKKIEIPGFSAPAPHVNGLELKFPVPSLPSFPQSARIPGIDEPIQIEYPAAGETPVQTNLNYTARNIDSSIISIDDIKLRPFYSRVTFSVGSLHNLASICLDDVQVALPKGINFETMVNDGSYVDPQTGVLHIPRLWIGEDGTGTSLLAVDAIKNLPQNGYIIDDHRNLVIDQQLSVKHATLIVNLNNSADLSALGSKITIDVNFEFSDLVAESVSGKIRYDVEDINIDPVSINDLPDFLSQEGTNLVLANPQIYLQLNNPLVQYNLGYQSGIAITQVRNDVHGNTLTLDNNGVFTVSGNQNITNFVLSPEMPGNVPDKFAGAQHVPFSQLSDVIAGDGIPQQLLINLVDPQVYEQTVNNFQLGTELPAVEGNWRIVAPLALKPGSGSKIIYTDRKTGWNDADVDAITINHLSLTMTADSKLPLNATLSGHPLDKNGSAIPGVTIKPVEIKGMQDGQTVELVVEGTVEHLDGFEFTATVNSASSEPLAPEQTITLKNIRAKVSGNYTKEL